MIGAAPATGPYRLTGLELAAGWVPGHAVAHLRALPDPPVSVRTALEQVLLPELTAEPCVVAFSGGLDSSVVLAVAVDLARRRGLPPPLPVTRHHPGIPSLDEEDWQRRVIDHLGIGEWLRLPFADDLDVVGPVAQRVLERHGVVWPAAAHASVPVFSAARGGVVVTGEGGDEVFLPPRLRRARAALAGAAAHAVVRGGAASRTTTRIRLAAGLVGPRGLRARHVRGAVGPMLPAWLTPPAKAWLFDALVADELAAPLGASTTLARLLTRRAWRTGAGTLAALAGDQGARVVHPLLHPHVLGAIRRASGLWGFADRTTALRRLFPDLLPRDVLERRTKTVFNAALFAGPSRGFVGSWTGAGVDTRLVDPQRLRDEWSRPVPSVLSAPLLQQAWLTTR